MRLRQPSARRDSARQANMSPDDAQQRRKAWIDGAIAISKAPHARPPCPECEGGTLEGEFVKGSDGKNGALIIRCPKCGAWNEVRLGPQGPEA